MDERLERAWAAGFFDGEGWAALEVQKGRRTGQPMAQINQADPDGVPEVLERFRRAVGCGQIYGPKKKEGRIDLYSWVASSRPNVTRTWQALAPWLGPVKRVQFATALDLPLLADRWDEATDQERRAWAGGLFDGEGSTCLLKHGSHAGYVVGEMSMTQSSPVGRPIVLERFRDVIGRGNVNGPVVYDDGLAYRWKTYSLDDIASCFHLLAPHIGRIKRQQAIRVIAALVRQPPLARGNPAWGSHKTHCVHGHEYATSRIRPYRSRRGGPQRRDNKQCLVCLRNYARRKWREKKLGGQDRPPSISESRERYLLK